MSMRVTIEAREKLDVHTVALDVRSDNWLDDARNDAERRQGVIEAANGLLRSLNLAEIVEEKET